MWSDNETNLDLINFSHFTELIQSIVSNEDLSPSTIGVFGDWGSGKSSLITLTEDKLAKEKNNLVIKFNGWLFEGYEDAKITLLSTLLSNIEKAIKEKKGVLEKADEEIKSLWKRIDWMKIAKESAKGIFKVATSPNPLSIFENITDEETLNKIKELKVGDFLKGKKEEIPLKKKYEKNISGFHKDFSSLLEKAKINKIIVFIDDLDRCNPDTIISTLEAIKLFLSVKKSAFIISADERIIRYAIQKKYPNIPAQSGRMDVGRDYLEKLIQFPIRIPQLNNTEMEIYINLLFLCLHENNTENRKEVINKVLLEDGQNLYKTDFVKEIIQNHYGTDITTNLVSDLTLSRQISRILTSTLHGNPRQCKRFLNMLMMRITMASSRSITLDKRVLAKIMVLEYLKPEAFRELSQWQANNKDGKPEELAELEDSNQSKNEEGDEKKKEDHTWLKDSEIRQWLLNDPKLAGIDLRSYFYFSRENLGLVFNNTGKLSNYVQEILSKLLSDSKSLVIKGLDDSKQLNALESSAVFEELKIKIEELPDKGYLSTTIKFVANHISLLSEFMTFIQRLQTKDIKPHIIPSFIDLFKNTEYQKEGCDILIKWRDCGDNEALSKIAKRKLK